MALGRDVLTYRLRARTMPRFAHGPHSARLGDAWSMRGSAMFETGGLIDDSRATRFRECPACLSLSRKRTGKAEPFDSFRFRRRPSSKAFTSSTVLLHRSRA